MKHQEYDKIECDNKIGGVDTNYLSYNKRKYIILKDLSSFKLRIIVFINILVIEYNKRNFLLEVYLNLNLILLRKKNSTYFHAQKIWRVRKY